MSDYGRVCVAAARAGGSVLTQYRNKFSVREKGPADLVTEADVASQVAVRDLVLGEFPDHAFLGEEDSGDAEFTHSTDVESEFTWIVDPLDGTTNYVHGLENYCVSVALKQNVNIIAGAIYDPVRDVCFHATIGGGAFRDEQRLQVSDTRQLDQALVAASLPARVPRGSGEIDRFVEVMLQCQAIRRLGSAALNLCYVAAGQLDAYWATSVKQWDVAAGLLIVAEAGGQVSHINGQELSLNDPKFIVSATPDLQQEMLDLFSRLPK